ncbi:MAG: phytanoyl-CoA dioxygenase family protein [Armatimonadetes bacterium]|nr:phytanoyl-CoA dioxygenase family protein [Armatimonadota bacterium]
MIGLTDEQRNSYEENGYLLVSGLIPEAVAEAAEAAMWRCIGADPNDPETWNVSKNHQVFDSPELVACYTLEFIRAAETLAGEEGFKPPAKAYAINVFPTDAEWTRPGPHIDHAIKDHGHKTFPRAFRVATMTFLNDVPPYGGGTVVWPGGHRQLEALAKSDPETYEMMYDLNRAWDKIDLDDPVELTPKRGDVLFYHYLCPHAGSKNVSDRPRLAMNMKW